MTKAECLELLSLAVPASDTANKDNIAKLCLSKAVSKFGMMKNVDWNRKRDTISLTSGKGEYDIGVDLLGDSKDGWDISEMWVEDSQGWVVELVDSEFFNMYKRGSTTTGKPIYATYRTADRLLEFYPTPNSAYSLWIEYRKDIKNFEEIPDVYHAPLLDYGILCVRALFDTNLAMKLSAESLKEMKEDSLTLWNGSNIDMRNVSTTYPKGNLVLSSDSGNLRGMR